MDADVNWTSMKLGCALPFGAYGVDIEGPRVVTAV